MFCWWKEWYSSIAFLTPNLLLHPMSQGVDNYPQLGFPEIQPFPIRSLNSLTCSLSFRVLLC